MAGEGQSARDHNFRLSGTTDTHTYTYAYTRTCTCTYPYSGTNADTDLEQTVVRVGSMARFDTKLQLGAFRHRRHTGNPVNVFHVERSPGPLNEMVLVSNEQSVRGNVLASHEPGPLMCNLARGRPQAPALPNSMEPQTFVLPD